MAEALSGENCGAATQVECCAFKLSCETHAAIPLLTY